MKNYFIKGLVAFTVEITFLSTDNIVNASNKGDSQQCYY